MTIAPIVDAEWLESNLEKVTVCDVRSAEAFGASHIRGAVSAPIDSVASSRAGPVVGRHPLPTPEDFATALGRLGIGEAETVVAYDDQGGVMAARLVWMLRMIGCEAALLDGGLSAGNFPLEAGSIDRSTVVRKAIAWPPDALAEADDVVAAIESGATVVDARAEGRYRGDTEPIDHRAGHIPGAINLACESNLGENGLFKDLDALRRRYAEAGVTEESIFYCGSGVTACHDLLVTEAIGIGKARLYVGSWSGWSSDPQRPAAFGTESDSPTFVQVFRRYGQAQGEKVAVTIGEKRLTYAELDERSTDLAHHLLKLGSGPGRFITIAEPNSLEYFVAFVACWKLGATPQPVSSRLPRLELEAIVELADSPVVIGTEHGTRPFLPAGFIAPPAPEGADLPDVAPSESWKAPTSGGSTGRPKLIVSGDPAIFTPSMKRLSQIIGASPHHTMVMPGPLYHNGPLIWSWFTLLQGGHLALLPRFDAEATLAAIAQHEATAIYLVPTMMQRIWKLPDDIKFAYDLSSLRTAFHLAEPCPKWLKEAWIDWLGPDVIWELYGGTEGQCFTVLDGNEWLTHPGSVGKPITGELKIMDDDGNDLPPGKTGSVWMRNTARATPTYRYVGAVAEESGGWECLGDMGWMDDNGYLYLADRRQDMILVGGSNVFPAEIEAAIAAHPKVRSSVVIGLPDEDKGSLIHAIVDAVNLDESELRTFLAERLVAYKLPGRFEFVSEPLRDDAGKVRRARLVAERTQQ